MATGVIILVAAVGRGYWVWQQTQSNVSTPITSTNTEIKLTDTIRDANDQSFDFNDVNHLFLKNVNWSVATSTSLGVRAAIWRTEKDIFFHQDVNFYGKEYFLKERQIKEGELPVFVDEKTLASYGWVDGMVTGVNYKNYRLVFVVDEAPYSGIRRYFRIKDDKLQTYTYNWNTSYKYVPCADGICDIVAGSGKETSRIFVSDPVFLADIVPANIDI